MVIFEGCKALCDIKTLSNKDLQPMVQVLMVFLSSSNSVNKFVSLKLLNKLISNPIRRSLIQNTSEIDSLIHDNNKSNYYSYALDRFLPLLFQSSLKSAGRRTLKNCSHKSTSIFLR
jgi:coatomer protein complex subunit gamma